MWIVNFLPSWFFYILIAGGAAGLVASYVLKNIPFISTYAVPVRLGSTLALLLGVWLHGADANNNAWVARVKEMEAKVAKAEEESKQANEQLNNEAQAKVTTIKQRTDTIYRYIDREVAKFDTTCVVPKEFIKIHNDAAEQPK